jgi:hypothetical protein
MLSYPQFQLKVCAMQKAGGIVALVAGMFGVIAAFFTQVVGGVGISVEAEGAQTVVELGRSGVLFSFLCIVLGAVAMRARSRIPGLLLIVCALAGAVWGGMLVALFMLLALVGGVLAVFSRGDITVPRRA